jgi:predicted nucleotidyltransferase
MTNQLRTISRQAIPILKRAGVKRSSIFGSAARGELKKKSDVDFLVELKSGSSLLDLAGLKLDLEDAIGRQVDLVTFRSLSPLIREKVLGEQVPIL